MSPRVSVRRVRVCLCVCVCGGAAAKPHLSTMPGSSSKVAMSRRCFHAAYCWSFSAGLGSLRCVSMSLMAWEWHRVRLEHEQACCGRL
jgi:hypothetical protein